MSLNERREYMLSCDRCSHCKWVPGAKSERFAQSCPSIQYGNFHSYSASGKAAIAFGLMEDRLPYSDTLIESVYDCTMCGACDTGCKWNHSGVVEPLDTLYALRERIAADGQMPPAYRQLIDNLEREGNPQGQPRRNRARWAQGLNLADIRQSPGAVLLHVGCDSAYDEAQWDDLRCTAQWLTDAGLDIAIACEDEGPAGELAFDLGRQDLAARQAEATVALWARHGVKQVITCSASAYAAFRNIYPRLGVALNGVTVAHVSDTLLGLLKAGRLKIDLAMQATVTYHDPCKLGRLSEPCVPWSGKRETAFNQVIVDVPARPVLFGNGGNYAAARGLLAAVDGVQLVEMERTRQFSYCCGAGAGAAEASPEFARHTAAHRLDEAEATGADVVVSACGRCAGHLRQTAVAEGRAIEVKTLMQLLREAGRPAAGAASAPGRTVASEASP